MTDRCMPIASTIRAICLKRCEHVPSRYTGVQHFTIDLVIVARAGFGSRPGVPRSSRDFVYP